ncbi:60S ribosomal export protein NMD3 [Tachypleus tridentatus]|uniref:60S ribosomal export protein NMD3 n=1 Tax=Tachypleus tridentatus TaxID=6853 RepID=UPI003FCFCDBC
MEFLTGEVEPSKGNKILCCQCGTTIDPNPANMCIACIRTLVDITEGIPKQATLYYCKSCERYLQPPAQWIVCALESRELLALCLKKLKGLNKIRLIDAGFVWTEPHSRRIKVKLTVQKEVLGGAVLQQVFVVEYIVNTQMCPDCHRNEAKDYWRAVVQVRQKTEHKKTFFYLEQLILKHKVHQSCLYLKASHEGLDFFFDKRDDARKFMEFVQALVPSRSITSQHLVSHDPQNNTFNYKYTFSVEIVPICKDDVVCLPLSLARSLGNIGQICVCVQITSTVHLVDPNTLQVAEINGQTYWRTPFSSLSSSKQLIEYTVMDIEMVMDADRKTFAGQGPLSTKHVLADVWLVRSSELGTANDHIHCRTHLGHILKPGDAVLGFDLANANINNPHFEKLKNDRIPDVVLVKKIYGDKARRTRKRKWKLQRMNMDMDTSSINRDFTDFLEDLEEDPEYRKNVNIYIDRDKMAVDSDDMDDEGTPQITLQEMLDDLSLRMDGAGNDGDEMIG